MLLSKGNNVSNSVKGTVPSLATHQARKVQVELRDIWGPSCSVPHWPGRTEGKSLSGLSSPRGPVMGSASGTVPACPAPGPSPQALSQDAAECPEGVAHGSPIWSHLWLTKLLSGRAAPCDTAWSEPFEADAESSLPGALLEAASQLPCMWPPCTTRTSLGQGQVPSALQ